MSNEEESKIIIERLLSVMWHAIDNGDWMVDGRCDPEIIMHEAFQHIGKTESQLFNEELAEAV